MSMPAQLTEKHPGGAFPDDSKTLLWLNSQREECNLLYQSRLAPDSPDCNDLLHTISMVQFRQEKQL
jgi:hypothetical protein